MTARDFTDAERATLDRFDAADDAPESLRERVADAIWTDGLPDGVRLPWLEVSPSTRRVYRQTADAAIAVMRGLS